MCLKKKGFCIILGEFFPLIQSSTLITCKMDFGAKASNIILVIFQMKIIFNNLFFQHNYTCLHEKSHLDIPCEII